MIRRCRARTAAAGGRPQAGLEGCRESLHSSTGLRVAEREAGTTVTASASRCRSTLVRCAGSTSIWSCSPPISGRSHQSGLTGYGGEPLATSVAAASVASAAVASVPASTEDRPPARTPDLFAVGVT
jgi:hypothetical protein